MSNLVQLLPLAFVMIAGPQIISAVFFATSVDWRKNSLAYIAGAALAITFFVTAAYLIAKGVKSSSSSSDGGGPGQAINAVILALLLLAAVYVFLKRKESEPPAWMGKLQTAGPTFSFKLGTALLGVFPTDIITSITVGSKVARDNDPWWYTLPFVLLTLFLLAIPMLLVLLLGQRAQRFLPKVRDWMNANSWIVSEAVIILFIGITINSLAS